MSDGVPRAVPIERHRRRRRSQREGCRGDNDEDCAGTADARLPRCELATANGQRRDAALKVDSQRPGGWTRRSRHSTLASRNAIPRYARARKINKKQKNNQTKNKKKGVRRKDAKRK